LNVGKYKRGKKKKRTERYAARPKNLKKKDQESSPRDAVGTKRKTQKRFRREDKTCDIVASVVQVHDAGSRMTLLNGRPSAKTKKGKIIRGTEIGKRGGGSSTCRLDRELGKL